LCASAQQPCWLSRSWPHRFLGTEDAVFVTTFLIDDTSLQVAQPVAP